MNFLTMDGNKMQATRPKSTEKESNPMEAAFGTEKAFNSFRDSYLWDWNKA